MLTFKYQPHRFIVIPIQVGICKRIWKNHHFSKERRLKLSLQRRIDANWSPVNERST